VNYKLRKMIEKDYKINILAVILNRLRKCWNQHGNHNTLNHSNNSINSLNNHNKYNKRGYLKLT
jgi:hypothetical protein